MAGITRTADAPAAHPHRAAPRGPGTRAAPLVAQSVIWAGAVAVLALWWSDTPSVVGLAGWLTDAGRITGLLAGYACAVLVALMARIPPLDRALGTDRLARWHAMGGRYTISLVLAHTLLILWGYSLTGGTGIVNETRTVVLNYPDMLKATAAFFLFLLTAVLSARAARRRVGYETWHYLHFATYAAIFLAFGHQLANGADFVGNQPARLAWYGLYLGAAALIVWFRFLAPVRAAWRHRLRVAGVCPEAPGVVSVHITGRRLEELAARPGQFFRWRFLAPGLWWTANPYSLSAPAGSGGLRITVKSVGGHSAALARLTPGTRIWAEGPYGALIPERARAGKSLLLAGGVGITPMRALFETLPGDTVLVYWARSPQDLALRGELDAIAAARGARVHYSVDTPAEYRLPLSADTLTRLVPDVARRDVYLCGPPGMTEAARKALRAAGVPGARVHHESFAF
ncbi:ferric reductase-like transmembrane domain-containing protein [Streptomyces sp. NPDC058001]|uniref:ferredoxin reductase family protein n=1 Tax=Streptomyces sp. NPDC058001 TaxID=3346300 RepID=UPI0036F128AD